MNHGKHTYVMIGFALVGAVLFLTDNAGGLLFLLWPLACVAMMVGMMWGMRGMGRNGPDPGDHARNDDLTHAHK